MSDKLIEIVEDHNSLVQALQFILEAAETKKLPPYGLLPTFNDSFLDDRLRIALELVTGEKYSRYIVYFLLLHLYKSKGWYLRRYHPLFNQKNFRITNSRKNL